MITFVSSAFADQPASKPNHLIHEKSPYLIQHAYNPVDWYPWGQEAFDKAKKENKPIFLSVGYSTCHWCHVMEDESYTNPQVAAVLNQFFVSIKVDREERPDVDSTYMQALEMMTGSGGWPMNMFLAPDLKPFYGGTYFQAQNLIEVAHSIANRWQTDRASIGQAISRYEEGLRDTNGKAGTSSQILNEQTLTKAYEQLRSEFDSQYGGFGFRPKFPQAHQLSFLLRYYKRTHESQALQMVEKTLQAMAEGGIYDQIGGGFHRYSTDAMWFVPHFEKMLYDQAMLSRAYLEAYQVTGKEEYAKIARQTLDYVLREMTSPEGGFYTAQDADSVDQSTNKKTEGAFYLWNKNEIIQALGKDKGEIFNYYFGVEDKGNADDFKNKNILFIAHDEQDTAKHFGNTEQEISAVIQEARLFLLSLRNQRPKPQTDDKTLTDLNGLMIASLSFGASVLNEPRYLEAAKKAADFLLKTIKVSDGHLMHRYRDGQVVIDGFLDDYAFFSYGLFELYESSFDPRYLAEAKQIAQQMTTLFGDKNQGGFYFTSTSNETIIKRKKEFNDNAIPSGNSMAGLVLLKLNRLTLDQDLGNWAQSALDGASTLINDNPSAYAQTLAVLDYMLGPSKEIVIVGEPNNSDTKAILQEINKHFLPNEVICIHPIDAAQAKAVEDLISFIKDYKMIGSKSTAYICSNHTCGLPTNDLKKIQQILIKK